jgi:hypothetical protein
VFVPRSAIGGSRTSREPLFFARRLRVWVRTRESLWVVALVHPESLPAAGSQGHDMNRAESERLQPLKFRFCSFHTDPFAVRALHQITA